MSHCLSNKCKPPTHCLINTDTHITHTLLAHFYCIYISLITSPCFEPMAAQEGHIPFNFKGSRIFPGQKLILVWLYNVGQLNIYEMERKRLCRKLEITLDCKKNTVSSVVGSTTRKLQKKSFISDI